MKMTFQPKKRSRSKVHGFRARIQLRPHICGLFFYFEIIFKEEVLDGFFRIFKEKQRFSDCI